MSWRGWPLGPPPGVEDEPEVGPEVIPSGTFRTRLCLVLEDGTEIEPDVLSIRGRKLTCEFTPLVDALVVKTRLYLDGLGAPIEKTGGMPLRIERNHRLTMECSISVSG